MPIRRVKPTSNARRGLSYLDTSDLDWPFRAAALEAFYDEVAAESR